MKGDSMGLGASSPRRLWFADVRLQPGHVEFGLHAGQYDLQEGTLLPRPRQLRPGNAARSSRPMEEPPVFWRRGAFLWVKGRDCAGLDLVVMGLCLEEQRSGCSGVGFCWNQ